MWEKNYYITFPTGHPASHQKYMPRLQIQNFQTPFPTLFRKIYKRHYLQINLGPFKLQFGSYLGTTLLGNGY